MKKEGGRSKQGVEYAKYTILRGYFIIEKKIAMGIVLEKELEIKEWDDEKGFISFHFLMLALNETFASMKQGKGWRISNSEVE
jgi:hypothetical protein